MRQSLFMPCIQDHLSECLQKQLHDYGIYVTFCQNSKQHTQCQTYGFRNISSVDRICKNIPEKNQITSCIKHCLRYHSDQT